MTKNDNTMGWIFIDKEDDKDMRSGMRDNMKRSGMRHIAGKSSEYEDGYKAGYKHGWEDRDSEDRHQEKREY